MACARSPLRTAQPSVGAPPRSSSKDTPLSPFPAATRWTLALTSPLAAPPAFEGGTGYFPLEGDQIVAYDLTVGKPRWTASARPQPYMIAGGGLLVFADAEALVALKTGDGSVSWTLPLSDKLVASPVLSEDVFVVATSTAVLALRSADGTVAWHYGLETPVHGTPSTSDGLLFVPLEDGRVIALRLDTGEMVWQRRVGGAPNDTRAVGDQVFVGSSDNYLYCLLARDGRIDWRSRTGADVISAPFVDERRVYFISLDNVLRALNRGHGVQQWKRVLPFRPAWSVLKAADTLVVVGLPGAASAFSMKNGSPAGESNFGVGVELAAPLHGFESNIALGPIIVAVTRNLATGATTITASSRSIEPPLLPTVQPLPAVVNPAVAERR
jgi:outer membrane protein assembly factor BamB